MSIRILIADDQALVRTGFKMILDAEADLEVVGEAENGREAVELAAELAPDVILMDIRMPGTDGITATRRIVTDPETKGCRVIILTTFDTDEHIFDAIRAGAAGFLLKNTAPEELRAAVRTVTGGEALLSPSVTRRVLAAVAADSGSMQPRLLDSLTGREREVLAQVAAGLSNAEIGAVLHLSPATARTYVSRLLAKLGARDRAQLVHIAYESGLVRPGRVSGRGESPHPR